MSHQKINRDRLFAAMKAAGVHTAIVSYSGSGDSGDFDEPNFYKADNGCVDVSNVEVDQTVTEYHRSKDRTRTENEVTKKVGLSEALLDWSDKAVEALHSGWENNDGASGELTFTVDDEQVALVHNEYYTESNTTENDL